MPSIDRNGVPIHFEDVGSGPPVVMGHSILCSGEMWMYQMPKLAERYRVINIDQRGHGQSVPVTSSYELRDMVEDAFAVLDHHASLVVIPGAGHLSALEKPEAVTEAMLQFLGGLHPHG